MGSIADGSPLLCPADTQTETEKDTYAHTQSFRELVDYTADPSQK